MFLFLYLFAVDSLEIDRHGGEDYIGINVHVKVVVMIFSTIVMIT